MDKAKGKRKMWEEDEGVQEQPPPGSETSSPPLRQDDPFGCYVYEIDENLTRRYQIQSKLDGGSSSDVLECWDREGQESVAIKVSRSTRHPSAIMCECSILHKLAERPESIPRVVQMRGSFAYRNHDCIVFEKLGPSLRKFLEMTDCRPVPLDLVWQFGRRLLEAVAFLHDTNVLHADLTPENILLASQYYTELLPRERSSSDEVQHSYWPQSSAIKVIDFGSSFILEPNHILAKNYFGDVTTRYYRAPEIVLGLEWTYPADLWSVGCILAELCTGQVLFQVHPKQDLEHLASMERVLGCLPKDMLQRAWKPESDWRHLIAVENFGTGLRLNWPEGTSSLTSMIRVNKHSSLQESLSRHVQSSELINLLCGLLKYEPSERLTALQAMDHPFFTKSKRWDIDQEGNITISYPKGK